jgi:hypothetical protein
MLNQSQAGLFFWENRKQVFFFEKKLQAGLLKVDGDIG